jgi:hypothetical protein
MCEQDGYLDYGYVRIYLDDSLKQWWVNGGSLISGLLVNDTGGMILDTAHSLWLNNIMIPAGKTGQIGIEYLQKSGVEMTSDKRFDFHVIQYFSETSGDTSGGSGGGVLSDTCSGGCVVVIGGDCGGGDLGDDIIGEGECPDTSVSSSGNVTLVDLNGNPMHLVGGVHTQVNFYRSSTQRPIFRRIKGTNQSATIYNKSCYVIPNPASDIAELRLTVSQNSKVKIKIADAVGKELFNTTQNAVEGLNSYSLNLQDYSAGIYYVSVYLDDKTSYRLKLVVVK